MKISQPCLERTGDVTRACAVVTWEDCDRPEREVFFETDAPYQDSLCASPNAFLTGAFVPALHHGERRIAVDGPICPALEEGLFAVAQLLRQWYGPPRVCPVIEPTERRIGLPEAPPRAGLFLSGGVDSLYMLRRNRLDYPRDHPASFRDALYAYGVDMAGVVGRNREAVYEDGRRALQPIVEETGLRLIPVRTNIKHLDGRWSFYGREFAGAILAAIAQAFSPRFSSVSIAATACAESLCPYGSHPLLDPMFSSSSVQVRHENISRHRFKKVKALVHWETALANLRVCFHYPFPPGQVNCGVCSKCTRTALEILAAGGDLRRVPTLPFDDLTPQMVAARVAVTDEQNLVFTRDLIAPLEAIGRSDLADVLKAKLRRHQIALARQSASALARGIARRIKAQLRPRS